MKATVDDDGGGWVNCSPSTIVRTAVVVVVASVGAATVGAALVGVVASVVVVVSSGVSVVEVVVGTGDAPFLIGQRVLVKFMRGQQQAQTVSASRG